MIKLYSLFLTVIVTTLSVFAQPPTQMSYQAVIRDSEGKLVVNTGVGMRIGILQGSAEGTAVYTETRTPVTNANGLVTFTIGGNGTNSVTGVFSAIDWSGGPYFIETETDPFVPKGTQAGEMQYWNGTEWETFAPASVNGQTLYFIDGKPQWGPRGMCSNDVHNPCPSGYRLPTDAEWNAEILSWSSIDAAGAFDSPLKLPLAGVRSSGDGGSLMHVGSVGRYWSSTVDGVNSRNLVFNDSGASLLSNGRSFGYSVRCIKD